MKRRGKRKSKFAGKVANNAERQRNKASSYGYLALPRGVNIFKEEPGSRMLLDIMPYKVTDAKHPDRDDELEIATPESLWYKRPFKLHRSIGPNNDSVVCPNSIGKKCPICEHRAKLISDGADWDDETVKALRSSDRNLYVVIPKGHKKYDEKPHIWNISQFLFQSKLNDELGEDEDLGVFPDLEEGLTLRIRFSEETFGGNTYADTSRIDFEARDAAYSEEILKDIPALDDVIPIPNYASVERLFFQLDDEDEDDGKVRRTRKTTTQQGDTDPEPEEQAEGEEEQEEQEEQQEEQEESDEDKKRNARRRKREEAKEENCPHGHKFGVDTDEFDECSKCEVWNECMDRLEANQAGG